MKNHRLNTRGFAHTVILIGAGVVVVIAGVFTLVLKHHDTQSNNNQVTAKHTSSSQGKASSSTSAQSKLSTTSAATSPTATTAPKSTSTTKTSSSTPTTTHTTATSSSATQTQTPLSVLTALITNLDNGSQVNITANAVTVPGPISNAQARPIVFSANGQVYFAYRQGSAPDFTASASQTANTMAIVNATVSNPALVQAHLDKTAELVDPNISSYLVGYSVGGN